MPSRISISVLYAEVVVFVLCAYIRVSLSMYFFFYVNIRVSVDLASTLVFLATK